VARLGENRWGKTSVRVSKVHRGSGGDAFSDLTVDIALRGAVEAAFTQGDNAGVIPTDTMKNTVYALAEERLGSDVESFASALAHHLQARDGVHGADVTVAQRRWERVTPTGFVGGSSERRIARVDAEDGSDRTWAGIEGLVVLKTTGSSFRDFPRDALTTLPDKDDRILATTVSARWRYGVVPADTTSTWERVRTVLIDRFFGDWSASVQHQGWMMGRAVLDEVLEITDIEFRLPNQHHLDLDLRPLGVDGSGTVFLPVSEPFGDIRLSVER
jgi:urate oxidase